MASLPGLNDSFDEIMLSRKCVDRAGFKFTFFEDPKKYNYIVIRNPKASRSLYEKVNEYSEKTLEEHIEFINYYKLEKAVIVAENIDFVSKCPTLKNIVVIPSLKATDKFDFSPLYSLPNITQLVCITEYGDIQNSYSTTVDYSRIPGLKKIEVTGKGNLNYGEVSTLEELVVREDKKIKDLNYLSCATNLKDVTFVHCALKSLEGLENLKEVQSLCLEYLYSLSDVSAVAKISKSLRVLQIESCPKITDFSCLFNLVNLEHLVLYGNNKLPTLSFLNNMKRLKTFCFSMIVEDCDITPCLQVPYAFLGKEKRAYNLKDKDLPKSLNTEPFQIV